MQGGSSIKIGLAELRGRVDYLKFTCADSVRSRWELPAYLVNQRKTETSGRYGYTMGLRFESGATAYVAPERPEMGVHVELSGSVLAEIERMTGYLGWDIIEYHEGKGDKCRRLDVALDCYDCGLDLERLGKMFDDGKVVCRARKGAYVKTLGERGATFYAGSLKARSKLFRAYDKAAESGVDGDWIRCELELHGDHAHAASGWFNEQDEPTGAIPQAITNFVDFPQYREWYMIFGSNAVAWQNPPKADGDTWQWLLRQCAPALAREIAADPSKWELFQRYVLELAQDER